MALLATKLIQRNIRYNSKDNREATAKEIQDLETIINQISQIITYLLRLKIL